MQRFAISFGALLFVSAAFATEQDWKDCRQAYDAPRAVAACGRLIDESSGKLSNDEIADVYATRGFAHSRDGNIDKAMADYAEALRRNPKQTSAYNYRGLTYLTIKNDARAIAEFSKGIEVDPKDAMIRTSRGLAYSLSGERNLALADYNAAITLDAKNFLPILNRGILYYYDGAPEKARDDFARAATVDPKGHMPAVWLHIAQRRLGEKSQLATDAQRLDMTRWPAPLIHMFLGEVTPESLLAPDNPDLVKVPALICDHNFYVAEFMSLQGNKREAHRLYEAAKDKCPRYFLEGVAVDEALRSIGKIK